MRTAYILNENLDITCQFFGMTKEEILEMAKEIENKKFKKTFSARNGELTGLSLNPNSDKFSVLFRYKGKRYYLGSFEELLAKCIYNVYITDKNIERPLNNIDMSIEEQRKLITDREYCFVGDKCVLV